MKKKSFNALTLRILLCLVLFLQVAAGVAIFQYSYRELHTQAETVSQKKAAAQASTNGLSQLQELQKQIDATNEVPQLVQNLFTSGDLPQFKAVSNLQAIAAEQGISIGNISFVDSETATPAAASGSSDTTATPTTGTSTTTASTVSISFSITSSVSYDTFLNFLNAIELNSPKLQIDSVDLPSGSSRASVQPGTLTLKMFLQ